MPNKRAPPSPPSAASGRLRQKARAAGFPSGGVGLQTPAGVIPPTGKTIALKFAEVFEIRDGKIRVMRAYWDTATLMQQLGLMPSPQVT
jgi:hypothetical protein